MRVTESRLVSLVTAAAGKARGDVATAQSELSTGRRVSKPSDDVSGWAEGKRAEVRQLQNDARRDLIGRSNEHLIATETALDTVSQGLARAKELAIQAANATLNAGDRQLLAREMETARNTALQAANSRGADGEYLLAGSNGSVEPFDATGAFVGDAFERTAEVGEGRSQVITMSGAVLTAAAGVDVIAVMSNLVTALDANDAAGIQTAIGDLDTAIEQVSTARGEAGIRSAALLEADDARADLDIALSNIQVRSIEADPLEAASALGQAANALTTAQTVAERVIALTAPRL